MWSYEPSAVAGDRDRLRLLIGDTLVSDQQFQDEELDYLLTSSGNLMSAAATACRALSARYARYADKWVGDLKILASQKARAYERLADQFEARGATYALPSAGGVYVAEKEVAAADSALVQPAFRVGVHDS